MVAGDDHGSDLIAQQERHLGGRGRAKHENQFRGGHGRPDRGRFCGIGHGKALHAGAGQRGGGWAQAVAIGVGLDHGNQAGRTQRRLDGRRVAAEPVQIHLHP